jgi:thiol-disulfide isomerase/thioredoxin
MTSRLMARFWVILLLLTVAGARAAEPTDDSKAHEERIRAIIMRDVVSQFGVASQVTGQGLPVDVVALDGAMRKFLADWPDEAAGRQLFVPYLRFAQQGDPARSEREVLELYLDSPSQGVREFVRDRLALATLKETPLELKFTALDGREVDMADLRGKVVLIDFWATWCKPCIAEMPHVQRVYAAYHERGFEILGISLDKAGDREKLVQLVAKLDLPWSQSFTGDGWEHPVARRFTVSAIPATFLFDQSGLLVGTDLRDEALDAAVAKLLMP